MDQAKACCRLCLIDCANNYNIIDDFMIKERITKIFHFEFDNADAYPKMICDDCFGITTNFHEYSEKVYNNQIYLKNLYETLEAENLKKELENVIKNEPAWTEEVKCEAEYDTTQDYSSLNEFGDSTIDDDAEEDVQEELDTRTRTRSSKLQSNITIIAKIAIPQKSKRPKLTKKSAAKIKKDSLIPNENKAKPKEERDREDELIQEYFKLVCDLCGTPTTSFTELRKHFRDVHGKGGYVKCCKKKMYRKCRMMEHLAKHMNPEAFRCNICNKNYSCRTSLELHNIHIHLSEAERPFKCDKCSKSFAKKYHLTCHMVRHVSVQCPQCDKMLASRLSLKDHLLKVHTDQGKLICDVCAKVFKSKQSFDRHVQEHFGTAPDTKVQCSICQRWLTDKQGLKKHVRTQHLEINDLFFCNICGKQSPNSTALASHKKTVHVEEKFECGICTKKFKRAISLKEHMAGHTGEVLYSCPYCTKTFNSNANMHSHKKKSHPKEWEENKKKM